MKPIKLTRVTCRFTTKTVLIRASVQLIKSGLFLLALFSGGAFATPPHHGCKICFNIKQFQLKTATAINITRVNRYSELGMRNMGFSSNSRRERNSIFNSPSGLLFINNNKSVFFNLLIKPKAVGIRFIFAR